MEGRTADMKISQIDRMRYNGEKMPSFQKYYRKCQEQRCKIIHLLYRCLFAYFKRKSHIELYFKTEIGEGLYIGHPYNITINKNVVIGKNCNIHKGVTIGQENRGERKGTPVIGNYVWIGVNATITGQIEIGNDVMIAPNTFVNCNVPSHSIVFGNPCIIKHKDFATEGYINHTIDRKGEMSYYDIHKTG